MGQHFFDSPSGWHGIDGYSDVFLPSSKKKKPRRKKVEMMDSYSSYESPLKFGDLSPGDKFVVYPRYNDKNFRTGSFVFQKVDLVGTNIEGYFENCMRVLDGAMFSWSESVEVLRIL
jgi:hypothetical protein